jgi:hypothetical protein
LQSLVSKPKWDEILNSTVSAVEIICVHEAIGNKIKWL